MNKLIITGLILCFSLNAFAECQSNIDVVSSDDYIIFDNATVTDKRTGLMWMTCSLGQYHSELGCAGEADEASWSQALVEAQFSNFAGHDDWRLPNIKELSSIIGIKCSNSRDNQINNMIFPNTPHDYLQTFYWSSSTFAGAKDRAWYVDFLGAYNQYVTYKTNEHYVRLVRTP
jgi:hypothetical protein